MRSLHTFSSEHQREWDGYLSLLTTAYNTQVNTSTGASLLTFVSTPRLEADNIERLPQVRPNDEQEPSYESVAVQYAGSANANPGGSEEPV